MSNVTSTSEAAPAAKEPTVKVTVSVMTRSTSDGSQHPGFGSAGIYWPTGDTTREVTLAQLKELQKDKDNRAPFTFLVHPEPAPDAKFPAKTTK